MLGLLKRHRAKPLDAHSILFGEYGLRSEAHGALGTFDPFNLALEIHAGSDSVAEMRLIMEGKLDEAKALVSDKLRTLAEADRLQYASEITAGIHELRHFHDHFFTTFGFSRITRILGDAIEFDRMWRELRKEPVIKLPLVKWAERADAPAALRRYMESRRKFLEWIRLYDGAFKVPDVTGQESATESLVVIQIKGLQSAIPAAVRNFKHSGTGKVSQMLTPLGGLALMEGAALVVQRHAITQLFGEQGWQELMQSLSWGTVEDDTWKIYMAVDIYLTKHFTKFYTRFQLALTDIAMMPPDKEDLQEMHPGWRLSKLTKAAIKLGPIYQNDNTDMIDYMNKLTTELGWPSMAEVTAGAIRRAEKVLGDTAVKPEKNTLWFSIMRMLSRLHLNAMQVREKMPNLLAEPEFYYVMQPHLPPPPIRSNGPQMEFRIMGEPGPERDSDVEALRMWFSFEHFQRQMLFSSKLPCARPQLAHDCPGDPLAWRLFSKWAETTACPSSRLAAAMGLPKLKFKKL